MLVLFQLRKTIIAVLVNNNNTALKSVVVVFFNVTSEFRHRSIIQYEKMRLILRLHLMV